MVAFNKNGVYAIQLASTLQSIAAVDTLVNQLATYYTITQQLHTHITIALNEAVTNAICHGNKQNTHKKVSIKMQIIENEKIICTITDQGAGFDYTALPRPTKAPNIVKLGGRGVFIMQQLSHLCVFNTIGNRVKLYFMM
jgi:serine/threonine-protein kinase RsbW